MRRSIEDGADRHRRRGTARPRRRTRRTIVAPLAVALAGLLASPSAFAAAGQKTHHHHRARHSSHAAHHPGAHHSVHRKPAAPPVSDEESTRRGETALNFAIDQLGKPYRYGGSGPDAYDCSGLVQKAWQAAGVWIPRTTQLQAQFGAPVPLDQVRDGDLVIFYADNSHVGIYAGDGKVIVAPHRGAVIKYTNMYSMPISTVRRPG
jgi:cell wall-associated NlpC family hydrolase